MIAAIHDKYPVPDPAFNTLSAEFGVNSKASNTLPYICGAEM